MGIKEQTRELMQETKDHKDKEQKKINERQAQLEKELDDAIKFDIKPEKEFKKDSKNILNENENFKKALDGSEQKFSNYESSSSVEINNIYDDNIVEEIEKKALRAIKISVASIAISIFLGILSLWVLLNQVTVSVGIDKKLITIEKQIKDMQKTESK